MEQDDMDANYLQNVYPELATAEFEIVGDQIDEGDEDRNAPLVLAPGASYNILSEKKDITLSQFRRWHAQQELELQPDYQRDYVMKRAVASRLIESVLMDVPIPIVYLAQNADGTHSVIDGQQRLSTFLFFMDGRFGSGTEFRLYNLELLKDLNRKAFKDLTREQQRKIENTSIPTIIIRKESNEDIKFSIFERLNTGSTKLNEDELRNIVYRGPLINLLARLSENNLFHKLYNKEEERRRMLYRGHILRFFALRERVKDYKASMKQFCNKYLRNNRHLTTERSIELEKTFADALHVVDAVFGDKAFRRYDYSPNADSGKWITEQVNMSLFDVQMVVLSWYPKSQVITRRQELFDAMIELMSHDREFIDAITYKTSDAKILRRRFEIWDRVVSRILE